MRKQEAAHGFECKPWKTISIKSQAAAETESGDLKKWHMIWHEFCISLWTRLSSVIDDNGVSHLKIQIILR